MPGDPFSLLLHAVAAGIELSGIQAEQAPQVSHAPVGFRLAAFVFRIVEAHDFDGVARRIAEKVTASGGARPGPLGLMTVRMKSGLQGPPTILMSKSGFSRSKRIAPPNASPSFTLFSRLQIRERSTPKARRSLCESTGTGHWAETVGWAQASPHSQLPVSGDRPTSPRKS